MPTERCPPGDVAKRPHPGPGPYASAWGPIGGRGVCFVREFLVCPSPRSDPASANLLSQAQVVSGGDWATDWILRSRLDAVQVCREAKEAFVDGLCNERPKPHVRGLNEDQQFSAPKTFRREQCRPVRRSARSINVCERTDGLWGPPPEVMCRVQREKTLHSGRRACLLSPYQGPNGNPGSKVLWAAVGEETGDVDQLLKVSLRLGDPIHLDADLLAFHAHIEARHA